MGGMVKEVEVLWQEFLHYLSEWAENGAKGLPETFDQWTARIYQSREQKTA